jgi:protein TonB
MLVPVVIAVLVAAAQVLPQTSAVQQTPPPAAKTQADAPWPPIGVSRMSPGVTAPRLIEDVKPRYSPEAMQAKIQGSVSLEAVVQADGTVGEVRVTRSLDPKFGLDDEAVSCLKKWRFKPGMKDGVAIAVLVEVQMSFTLRK